MIPITISASGAPQERSKNRISCWRRPPRDRFFFLRLSTYITPPSSYTNMHTQKIESIFSVIPLFSPVFFYLCTPRSAWLATADVLAPGRGGRRPDLELGVGYLCRCHTTLTFNVVSLWFIPHSSPVVLVRKERGDHNSRRKAPHSFARARVYPVLRIYSPTFPLQ